MTLFPCSSTRGADLLPGYSESVQLAAGHAANPAGWQPASLYVIPDPGGTEGLFYDGGKLIVRTATKSGNFKGNFVGQPGYKIYGDPSVEAAWVTTGNDATRFLLANSVNGSNVTRLLERGLGMDATGTHDAIVEYSVNTGYIMRPTKNPDISQYLPAQYGQNMPFLKPAGMSGADFDKFKTYYNYWVSMAYSSYNFPFTQLGYTFFWGNGYSLGNINGMSEFIILGQTPVDIYGIYATQSYIYTRNDGTNFSTAAGASYGNGFASFKIDGPCDTVWAGHRFQKNVRTAIATPNQIIIESGGSVSGGQGILVWSLNYDVINNGSITGATANKFNIANTSNIAVLFKGDTSGAYGTPIATAGAVNRLTNAGLISSPGTAIKAEAGDTVITNNAGGTISGGNYAIQTGPGNDTVTVNGGRITGKIDLGAGTDAVNVTGANQAQFDVPLERPLMNTPRIVNAETVTIANNTKFSLIPGPENIRDNDRFLVADATTLNVNPSNLVITPTTALPMIRFSASNESNKLYIISSRDNSYYTQLSGNPSLGAVLDGLANTGTGDMSYVIGGLDSSGNAANARKLGPSVDQGILQAAFGTVGRFTQTVISRMDQVQKNNVMLASLAPVSVGKDPVKWNAWAQGFGAYLNQDPRDLSMGYTAQIWGTSLGADRLFSEHSLLGISGGYAKTNIRTSDSATWTDIASYQGSVYASYFRDRWYLDGIISFAGNLYDQSRHISFGTIDRTARSDYRGYQYSGYVEGGYTFKTGGWDITPLASLQYAHLHIPGYSETGADSVSLAVGPQDYDMLQSGIGAKFAYPVQWNDSKIIPEFHLKWFYDCIGDRQQVTSTFTGGGASFVTEGFKPAQSSYNAGARITLVNKYGITASLNYDFEIKQDFYSHTGYANIQIPF